MKKTILSALLLISAVSGFSQARVLGGFYDNGMLGMRVPDTLKNINVTSPLYPVNDTTWGTHAIDSLKIINDSVYGRHDNNFTFQYKNSSAAAGWSLAGNSITAATDYFGTNNNTSVRFRTNNTQYMVLDSNGRLGLGILLPTAKFHLVTNALGATVTSANGILLQNQTAATLGNQQWSPFTTYSGQNWNTGASASQSVDFRTGVNPVQGTQAVGNYLFQFNPNNAGWSTIGTMDQGGSLTMTGALNQQATSGDNTFATDIFFTSTNGNRGIRFNAGGATLRGGIWHQQTLGDIDIRTGDATSQSTGILSARFVQVTGDALFGSTSTANDAIVRMESTGKGVVYPSMTQAQRDSMNLTVTGITVANGGTGYATTATATFSAAPSGWVTATANVPTRSGGVITAVTIATAGSYKNTPTITAGGSGTGAILFPVMTQVLSTGLTIFCSNCTATDASTGVMQTWNGTAWKNNW